MKKTILVITLLSIALLSIGTIETDAQMPSSKAQKVFFKKLRKMCGRQFEGATEFPTNADHALVGKKLLMKIETCADSEIRIPFRVGEDKSRTWIITLSNTGLLFKHDHRHEDGAPDKITMYGGWTTSVGAATRQMFPADQQTVDILPAAATNAWWIDLVPGEYFTYNLRRMGTDRYFSIKFDLTKEVKTPEAPWGWKD